MIDCSYTLPKQGDYAEILSHLQAMDDAYAVKLSDRVDLYAYAKKICDNATLFTARDNGKLIGLVAIYVKKQPALSFCTDVSVLPAYQLHKGVGSSLMRFAIQYVCDFGGAGIALIADMRLYDFYKRLGFVQCSTPYKLDEGEIYLEYRGTCCSPISNL